MKINIAVVTIDEPFYIPFMIKNLLDNSPPSLKYCCIVIVPSTPSKMSKFEYVSKQLGVFGISQFSKILLMYGWKRILNNISNKEYSTAKVALNRNIPILKTNSLKDDIFLQKLKLHSLDIILSVASSRIFGKEMLSLPRVACLNVHAGKLPKYRGINPSFWVLLNQEMESAITVHYMNEKIDDGDIVAQDIFSIEKMRSLNQVYLRVLEVAPRTVLNCLLDFEEGKIKRVKNDSSASSYYSFPNKEDGKKFRSLGLSFL